MKEEAISEEDPLAVVANNEVKQEIIDTSSLMDQDLLDATAKDHAEAAYNDSKTGQDDIKEEIKYQDFTIENGDI